MKCMSCLVFLHVVLKDLNFVKVLQKIAKSSLFKQLNY